MDSKLFHVQYMTSPAEKCANIKVKIIGRNLNIFACIGSGGVGFKRCCMYMVIPIKIGHIPIFIKAKKLSDGTTQGNKPKRFKIDVGSGADKSCIHAKNGAWRISIVTNNTLYKAKKTGI